MATFRWLTLYMYIPGDRTGWKTSLKIQRYPTPVWQNGKNVDSNAEKQEILAAIEQRFSA